MGRTSLLAVAIGASAAVSAAAPGAALALEHDVRTGPITGTPLVVEPSPGGGQAWFDAGATFDFAPLGMTLSDGRRWRRSPSDARWDFSIGAALPRFAAAIQGGHDLGVAVQLNVVVVDDRLLGVTVTGRTTDGAAGWDASVVPAYSARLTSWRWATLVPFGAARLRVARTLYDVQGWSSDRSSPFATAETRDVALAAMAGIAATWRFAELRLTTGWEIFLVDRLSWEDRPTSFSRSGGPFALVLVRGRIATRSTP